ncbi:hypothetical protein AFLA_005082 [Aspergillus flavus NRRL3357]|nr:hypothetical protein AFLA_005082 [Aspergillus flavus NRRL3357]
MFQKLRFTTADVLVASLQDDPGWCLRRRELSSFHSTPLVDQLGYLEDTVHLFALLIRFWTLRKGSKQGRVSAIEETSIHELQLHTSIKQVTTKKIGNTGPIFATSQDQNFLGYQPC